MKKLLKKLKAAIEKWLRKNVADIDPYEPQGAEEVVVPETEPEPAPDTPESAPEPEPEPSQTATTNKIAWRYGGVDGSKARETDAARIGSLKISQSGLSYKWEKGGCEQLGATSRSDCDHTLACAFWWDGSQWVGGKFDWISTSRTTRDFKNIDSGHRGWEPAKFRAAKRKAFCIMSANGKLRTNLAVWEG